MNKPLYLNDKDFLKALDAEPYKEQFIKITILDFKTEQPLVNLEGKATNGSCNVSGTSNMRRTASCTVAVDPRGIQKIGYNDTVQYYNVTEIENLISMNKKIKLSLGITNTLKNIPKYSQYAKYSIIWYPLGTYAIKAASVAKNNSGINISLTLNDKCVLLNGDMGGIIPAGTIFSETEIFNSTGTKREVQKIPIKDMIRNIVTEFGGEPAENVIINDIPDTIRKVVKWTGKSPIYLITTNGKKQLTLTKPTDLTLTYLTFEYGQDIGYMNETFVYPGTLECNAGESVAAVLDKIKNVLGNYEWFYDLDGRFVFQQIKNYLNESPASYLLELEKKDYYTIPNLSISTYTFDENNLKLVNSISSSPQFQNIKNDFIVWGTTKTASGAEKPIRYRLAFDDKPRPGQKLYFGFVHNDYRDLRVAHPIFENEYTIISNMAEVKDKDKYYLLPVNGVLQIIKWDEENKCFRYFPEYQLCYFKSTDWRTELYYEGLWDQQKSFSAKPYSAELNSEWPKICNIASIVVGDEALDSFLIPVYTDEYWQGINPSAYEYWLDILEGSEFNVNTIGRRTKVVTDKGSNCLFPSLIQNYIYIEADGDTEKERQIAKDNRQEIIQIPSNIFNKLVLGGTHSAAFDKIKELMYLHTNYNENVNISVTPIYHLEPNTIIVINDKETGVNGNYLIKSISLPLAASGTSSITATKLVSKDQWEMGSQAPKGKAILDTAILGKTKLQ